MRRLLLVAVVAACGGSSSPQISFASKLIVQAAGGQPLTIASPGRTLQLGAYRQESNGGYGGGTTLQAVTASWTTSAPSIATVDGTGLVTGVAAGSADITAAEGGMSAKATVTVGPPPAPVVITWSLAAQSAAVTTTVAAGTPVQWFASDVRHTVVADTSPPPDMVSVNAGATSPAQTITVKGTYPYHCSLHPGMHGTLVVQ